MFLIVLTDFEDKVKLAKMFYEVKQSESQKYEKLVQYDVLSSDEHERVYSRIFMDEIQALVTEESMLFQNMYFAVSPIVSCYLFFCVIFSAEPKLEFDYSNSQTENRELNVTSK